jgi:hypothetical protein
VPEDSLRLFGMLWLGRHGQEKYAQNTHGAFRSMSDDVFIVTTLLGVVLRFAHLVCVQNVDLGAIVTSNKGACSL